MPGLGEVWCIPVSRVEVRRRIVRREEYKGIEKIKQGCLVVSVEYRKGIPRCLSLPAVTQATT